MIETSFTDTVAIVPISWGRVNRFSGKTAALYKKILKNARGDMAFCTKTEGGSGVK
jgi:hypothetical protein